MKMKLLTAMLFIDVYSAIKFHKFKMRLFPTEAVDHQIFNCKQIYEFNKTKPKGTSNTRKV